MTTVKSLNKKGIECKQPGIEVIRNTSLCEILCKLLAAKLMETCERMTFVYRTINVVNPKFIVVNTCSESTESAQVKKNAAVFGIFSREKPRSKKKKKKSRKFLRNPKGHVPNMKSTEPELVTVLEKFQENVELCPL